ncbi:hypothetical protein [Paraburkholderia lacunae]|uniref:4-oxalocrotonate tautomerase n=1 Tax=Paraburkholderia lacunae TaxID=2211104 RepID=A0A370N7X8_9BURK|nr:hypothetical protein [Paraburkholderia lacunae]RDK01730.1 hypothetical protein DLM46_15295 [Paraburkholderia lacunae]
MPSATVVLCGKKPEAARINTLHREMALIIERDLGALKALVSTRVLWDDAGTWSVAGIAIDESTAGTGAFVEILIAADAVDEQQMATAMKSIQATLTDLLGKNALPPYVVFTRVPTECWGFKGKSIKQIKSEMRS